MLNCPGNRSFHPFCAQNFAQNFEAAQNIRKVDPPSVDSATEKPEIAAGTSLSPKTMMQKCTSACCHD